LCSAVLEPGGASLDSQRDYAKGGRFAGLLPACGERWDRAAEPGRGTTGEWGLERGPAMYTLDRLELIAFVAARTDTFEHR
jgi:hypothetical protein